jgi:hypothetical protein
VGRFGGGGGEHREDDDVFGGGGDDDLGGGDDDHFGDGGGGIGVSPGLVDRFGRLQVDGGEEGGECDAESEGGEDERSLWEQAQRLMRTEEERKAEQAEVVRKKEQSSSKYKEATAKQEEDTVRRWNDIVAAHIQSRTWKTLHSEGGSEGGSEGCSEGALTRCSVPGCLQTADARCTECASAGTHFCASCYHAEHKGKPPHRTEFVGKSGGYTGMEPVGWLKPVLSKGVCPNGCGSEDDTVLNHRQVGYSPAPPLP